MSVPDYPLEASVDFKFTSRAFATGIPTVLAGSPVVEIYEDNSITQITAAETLTVDFDSVVGLNNLRVVATAANGFEAGKSYQCIISTGTVGGVSVVGEVVAQFSIERAAALMPTTAGRKLDVTAAGNAGIDWANVENPTTTLDLSATDINLVDTTTANTDMRGTDSALLAASAPTNFGDLSISATTGLVKLAATGLDAIASTALGMVEIAKAVWDRALTGATHNIATSAGRRLRTLQDFGVYEGGHVWLDTTNGTAGTVDFENGTVNLPSLTLADALTIMNSVPLPGLHLLPGTSITFTATINQKEIVGEGYTVALGGQDVDFMHFTNAVVSGIGTAANSMHFKDCVINTASVQNAEFTGSTFNGTLTLTMTLAGNYNYINCQSGVAGPGSPTFTKTAGQTITAQWRRWAGSLTVSNIEVGDVMTIGGTLGTVTLNGVGGTVEIRGTYKAIVDNRTGSPVLNLEGALNEEVLVDATWDEVITAAAHNVTNSAAKKLRQTSNAIAYEGNVNDGSPTASSFILDAAASTEDNFYNDASFSFIDGALNGQARTVTDYVGATKTVSFDEPFTSVPSNGDGIQIASDHVHPVSQIVEGLLTTQMTENYAADGTAPTLTQALMLIQQKLGDFSITGTTLTVNKIDGATPAATFTLDDATNPTSTTRAS